MVSQESEDVKLLFIQEELSQHGEWLSDLLTEIIEKRQLVQTHELADSISLLLITCLIAVLLTSCEDNKPTFTRAAIISENFVSPRMKYPAEVEFEGDRRGSETSQNEYDVFQKFTAKNAFGVKSSYVYKIHMIYKSGDWTDVNSWTYDSLVIEEISTGEQHKYNSPTD